MTQNEISIALSFFSIGVSTTIIVILLARLK
jgi:hypothetical protein